MIGYWLREVRVRRPLVHNITNLVVNNTVANALLSIGASPVMAQAHEEVADMARISAAIALNIGTLSPELVTAMQIAGKSANEAGIPVIFDPVGVGATPYRTRTATDIVRSLQLTVLRGNAGEIGYMLGSGGKVTGVDSAGASAAMPIAMKQYAKEHHSVVVATGEIDWVTDGQQVWKLQNGHSLMAAVTGSGCSLTGILGAFAGVVPRRSPLGTYAEAVIAGITCFNVAAEKAALLAQGPGTFQAAFFDALYRIDGDDVERNAHIEVVDID